MIEEVPVVIEHVRSLCNLLGSDLPRPLRRKYAWSAMWLAFIKVTTTIGPFRGYVPPNPIRVAGFRISYFQFNQLSYLFREIFVDTGYWFQADSDQPFIIDCGSNIGMSLLFFKSLYPQARIVGFEPEPETFRKLRDNVVQNGLHNVDVHPYALGAEEGSIKFFHDTQERGALTMSIYEQRLTGTAISVPAKLLSSFIDREVDLLKMDIEGAEVVVIPELAASGKLGLIKQLHLEYHHHIHSHRDDLSVLLRTLEDFGMGYHISVMDRAGKLRPAGHAQDILIYAYRK
jgi:FkbM family methyltransferase